MNKDSLSQKLSKLQSELKVGKPRFNKFGGFSYRNTEDIFEAVKPLLSKYELTLTLNEKMESLGSSQERFYKVTTAIISDGKESVSVNAYTREDESQKGLTSSQLSGAVGSYGAKMALRGLLLLDDTLDDDNPKNENYKLNEVEQKNDHHEHLESSVMKPQSSTSFKRKPKAFTQKEEIEDDF